MRRLKAFLRAFVLVYLIVLAGLFWFRASFVFPFEKSPEQVVGLKGLREHRLDGDVVVWAKPPRGNAPVVLFFGGNKGLLSLNIPRLRELGLQGIGIAALGYRGSGGRPGIPSEAQLFADAELVYAQLDTLMGRDISVDRRFVYGVSLGTGVATDLAAKRDVSGLILETPYTRFCDVAFAHYPIFPTCLALYDARFDNLAKIAGINASLLVLHGTADQVVPFDLGARLFEAASEPKRFVRFEGGRHNDLRLFGAGQEILDFMRQG